MSRKLELTSCTIDLETGDVSEDADVRLTHRELALLRHLVERSPEVVDRETLSTEVFGYHPQVVTRAVDKAMHGLRAKVERDPGEPDHLHTVAGVGYRFVAVERPDVSTNLRPPRGPLLGREEDAAGLIRALARSEVVLVGPGGVGKTHLARAVAWERRGAFPGGVWLCDLSRASTLDDLLVGVGSCVGEQPRDVPSFGAWLARQPALLLVLDNADAVTSLGETILQWSAAAPSVRFLVTSRVLVSALPCRRVEPLGMDAALRLLELRVDDLGGSIAEADRDLLPALLERLDRLPLAIECAAFPLAMAMTARELHDHVKQFREVPAPGDPARKGAMVSMVATSWSLLGANLREALVALGAIPGSITADGAAAALDLDPDGALSVLAVLRQRSLLEGLRAPSEPDRLRFALYESVRDFVAGLAGWTDERHAAWARYRRWLLERAEVQAPSVDLGSPGQRFLSAERASLLAVVDEVERDPDDAMRALALLEGTWLARDPRAFAEALDRVLEVGGERLQREHRLLGRSLFAYASVLAREGNWREHLAALEEVVEQLAPTDDPKVGVRICSRFSAAAFANGDGRRAARGAQLRLSHWAHAMSARERMGLHISMGNGLRLLGDLEGAEAQYRLALVRPADPLGEAIAWSNIALLRSPDESVPLFRRALAVMPPENRQTECGLRADYAGSLAATLASEEARAEALIARTDARAVGRPAAWFRSNLVLAQLDRERRAFDEALAWLDELAAESRFDVWQDTVWDLRGTVLVDAGRFEQASSAFHRALAGAVKPSPYDVGVLARAHLAVALARLGRHEEARAAIDRALEDHSEPLSGSARTWSLPRLALTVRALEGSADPAELRQAQRRLPLVSVHKTPYLPLEVVLAKRWLEQALEDASAAASRRTPPTG